MKTIRVLVAEDDPDHRFLIGRALKGVRGVNLEVVAVADGEEALELLQQRGRYTQQRRPHVMLLDLRMPRLGGLEVLSEVKQDPVLSRIPVCVLTSSDRQEDVDEAYLRGTNSYVVKARDMHGIRHVLAAVSEFWGSLVALPEPP